MKYLQRLTFLLSTPDMSHITDDNLVRFTRGLFAGLRSTLAMEILFLAFTIWCALSFLWQPPEIWNIVWIQVYVMTIMCFVTAIAIGFMINRLNKIRRLIEMPPTWTVVSNPAR